MSRLKEGVLALETDRPAPEPIEGWKENSKSYITYADGMKFGR